MQPPMTMRTSHGDLRAGQRAVVALCGACCYGLFLSGLPPRNFCRVRPGWRRPPVHFRCRDWRRGVRKDLPCNVTPVKPALGFDLRSPHGYDVNVPLEELAGVENGATMSI